MYAVQIRMTESNKLFSTMNEVFVDRDGMLYDAPQGKSSFLTLRQAQLTRKNLENRLFHKTFDCQLVLVTVEVKLVVTML